MSLLSLNKYTDLIVKCKHELKALKSCESHPDYDFILFNIVVGLNHLFEWYLKEKNVSLPKKLECIEKFNPFSSPYDVSGDFKNLYKNLEKFPTTNLHQEMIRKLCNKAKHFKQSPKEKQDKHYTAVCGSDNMQCGSPKAVCGGYDHYIYSIEINGAEQNLEHLVSSLIKEWVGHTKSDM